ncbi:MAG: hypothetical protein NZ908_01955 [Candidatus Micrarchaeota archaeon]|nr:hypothetical protein [Candidatus Micrarchaeota archaeon]MCX8154529.1 hypothetical protein [Candidatus Micrarchaeota archaeon]
MNLSKAMEIANKHITTSLITIIYSTFLFYVTIFATLGAGVIMYSMYKIYIDIIYLVFLGFYVFFPGYLFSQIDLFWNVIKQNRKSFNRLTEKLIVGSLQALPITIIKSLFLILFMIPSILSYQFLNFDILTIALVALNFLIGMAISEYIFYYPYFLYIVLQKKLVESIVEGIKLSLTNLFRMSIMYFPYMLAVLIQTIPLLNLIVIFWTPVLHVYVVGNTMRDRS